MVHILRIPISVLCCVYDHVKPVLQESLDQWEEFIMFKMADF